MSLAEHAGLGLQHDPIRISSRTPSFHAPLDPVLRRLEQAAFLDEQERDLVKLLTGPMMNHRTGADLGDDSDSGSRYLTSGWACRVCDTPWGGRQIIDIVLPGDPIGVSMAPRMDGLYRVIALTRGTHVSAAALRDRLRADSETYPRLAGACLREDRAIASRMIGHTTRIGAPTATQAIVHLLLELRARMAEVGQLDGERFPMLLSQENLHDALGITVTQVYRILTQLRRDKLITMGTGWTEIASPAALAAFAGLDGWRP